MVNKAQRWYRRTGTFEPGGVGGGYEGWASETLLPEK